MASEAVRWFCQVALPLSSFLPSFPPFLSSHQDFGAIRVSTLTLVDLAGSERIAKTGAEGQRMKEVRNAAGGHGSAKHSGTACASAALAPRASQLVLAVVLQ